MGKKRRKRILTPFEKKQKKQGKDIKDTLKNMGFLYLKTEGIHKVIGLKRSEIDGVHIYENIVLVCEKSLDQDLKEHVRKKAQYYAQINKNKKQFITWLKETYAGKIVDYDIARYKIKFLYFHEQTASEDTKELYNTKELKINFLDDKDLIFFKRLSNAIKLSAKYELFRFLDLELNDIGVPKSEEHPNEIESAVIVPEMNCGFPDGIQIVSFLMSAEQLLKCAYVLRKDNWENRVELYQRLVDPAKINKIREFVADQRKAFINNVIVSLPNYVEFYKKDTHGKYELIDVSLIERIQNLKIKFPEKFNSIRIIDGQHRLYAHYEGNDADKYESEIKKLRNKLYMLVTGLIFPKDYLDRSKTMLEGKLFLEINDNQKKVTPLNLLTTIALLYPETDVAVSIRVLNSLNQKEIFLNYFELNALKSGKIKVPSLIKWGLKSLVDTVDDQQSLYHYWKESSGLSLDDKGIDSKEYEVAFNSYIDFCVKKISIYFSGVKSAFKDDWESKDIDNRFFSVTSITGFIIAFRRSLPKYGIKEYSFYRDKLKKLEINFKKGMFPFKSSHWNDFAKKIEDQCWD
jgi:DGQHR domain-containing protein